MTCDALTEIKLTKLRDSQIDFQQKLCVCQLYKRKLDDSFGAQLNPLHIKRYYYYESINEYVMHHILWYLNNNSLRKSNINT